MQSVIEKIDAAITELKSVEKNSRELSLCLTNLQQARQWAMTDIHISQKGEHSEMLTGKFSRRD